MKKKYYPKTFAVCLICEQNFRAWPYEIRMGVKYCSLKCKNQGSKGRIPWDKGKHFSLEHRKKLSLAHIGKKMSEETKAKLRGHISPNKGKHIQTNTGRTHFKKGMTPFNKGKKEELIKVDKNELYQLYVNEKLSTREVAQKMNISKPTINNRLRNYGWLRTQSEGQMGRKDSEEICEKRRKPIDKDKLYQLYCVEKYSTTDLEKVFNADRATIGKRLIKYGWIRPTKEAHNQPIYIKKLRDANLGKKATLETRDKLSKSHIGLSSGEDHWNWQGGITPINNRIRQSNQYREWKKFILERDNYTCQICNKRGGILHANHIKKFKNYPELRFEVINGITLCEYCHIKIVSHHELEWESYFNFNLETRGFLEDKFIPLELNTGGGITYNN